MRLATDIVLKAKESAEGLGEIAVGYSITGGRGGKTEAQIGLRSGAHKNWRLPKIFFNQGRNKTPTKVLGSLLALVRADRRGESDGERWEIQLVLFWISPERPLALTSSLRRSAMHLVEPSCVILVVIPDLELLSGAAFACGEFLQLHLVDLAPDLLLHLGDFLFRVDGLGLGVVQDQLAPEQMSVFERPDAVLRLSWRLKFRKGESTSVVCFRG